MLRKQRGTILLNLDHASAITAKVGREAHELNRHRMLSFNHLHPHQAFYSMLHKVIKERGGKISFGQRSKTFKLRKEMHDSNIVKARGQL